MNTISKRARCALLVGLTSLAGLSLSACSGDGETPAQLSATDPKPPVAADPPPTSTPLQAPPNTAPSIAGAMPSVVEVGKAFSFTPTAADAERDTLVFKIAGKPAWGAFDTRTGRLTGTPTQKDVGVNEDVVISVTDGKATASLPKTNVTVQAGTARVNATISWVPPTQTVDGNALSNLSGYKLYYGTKSKQYQKSIAITNAGLTRYMVEGLVPGMYYFTVTAVTSNGIESTFSPEVGGEIS